MRLQNSLDRALQQQGFHSENIHKTAQIAWQDSEREALCVICRELGIDAQRNQGIGQGRKSLTPQEYRRAKEEQQAQIEDELKPLKEELDEYKELNVSANAFIVEKKKVPFSKKVTVSAEVLEKLEEQARAYRVNQYEIDTLRTRTTALDEREQKLTDQEKLHARAEEVLVKKLNNAKQLYDRQKNVNQLLEQSENMVSTLSALIGSLRAQLAERDKTISELQERLETALQNVRGAYESLTNVVKAVGMLKYDKEHGYGVNLTEKQGRLIDALARYGAGWAMKDGHPDLAKAMNEQVGISQGIQEDIKALTPKISRGRGGRGF